MRILVNGYWENDNLGIHEHTKASSVITTWLFSSNHVIRQIFVSKILFYSNKFIISRTLPGVCSKVTRSLIFFGEIKCSLQFTTYFPRYSFISPHYCHCVNHREHLVCFLTLKTFNFLELFQSSAVSVRPLCGVYSFDECSCYRKYRREVGRSFLVASVLERTSMY
jgi:hypothetical protein